MPVFVKVIEHYFSDDSVIIEYIHHTVNVVSYIC